ncbi:UBX domain-containing protein 10 [Paramormyrops kingsleyae]|uniref:UBX domain-containing protein 10 n=1 Tax=Paramormyrops kingsleyae TaxID=1676925 RepID=UPI000CD607E5|nr:UBX domain-containing protein 10 [Paramormyrops kingsleyae]XP_023690691.1 UBX domain-containing protein 10 [Paramormyrops kingsleyae]
MHVTRPKSSKGRCRPAVSHAYSVGGVSYHNVPGLPRTSSLAHEKASSSVHLLSHSHSLLKQTSVVSVDEVTELLQNTPTPPALTLNRYRVLPSIEKRHTSGDMPFQGMEEKASRLSRSDHLFKKGRHHHWQQAIPPSRSHPEISNSSEAQCGVVTEPSDLAALPLETPDGIYGGLLLAIRSPSGRRFQQHFHSSETLQTVLAAAEARYGTKYEDSIIETMDVPRMSFTDLTQTLAESGIRNRSVVCITQEYSSTDSL